MNEKKRRTTMTKKYTQKMALEFRAEALAAGDVFAAGMFEAEAAFLFEGGEPSNDNPRWVEWMEADRLYLEAFELGLCPKMKNGEYVR
jgi:hypothetical protein